MITASPTFSATTTVGGVAVMLGLVAFLVTNEARRQSHRPGLGRRWRSASALLVVVFAADVILRFAVLGHGF